MRRLIDSLGAAIVGYIAASVAAGFSYTLLLVAAIHLTGSIAEPSEMAAAQQIQSLIGFAALATLLIAVVAFVPFLPVIVVLILAGRRDVVSYVVAGIAISVVSVMIARRNVIFMDKLELNWLVLATGAIAGMAFWAVMRKMAPAQVAGLSKQG